MVVVQRHGVGDDLKAIIQAAVMLAVDALLTVSVGILDDIPCVGGIFTGIVDLQLYAEVAVSLAVENVREVS